MARIPHQANSPMSRISKQPRAEQWADQVCTQLGKSVESIVAVGRLLTKAKADLAHGEWGRMFDDQLLPFSQDTAQRLMTIAANPELSNSANARYLPPSWTSLFELTKVEPDRLHAALRDRVIAPDMKRRDVAALLPPKARPLQPAETIVIDKEPESGTISGQPPQIFTASIAFGLPEGNPSPDEVSAAVEGLVVSTFSILKKIERKYFLKRLKQLIDRLGLRLEEQTL